MTTIPISALPKTLAEIAEACGMDVAEALVEHFGGVRIWVPAKPSADCPLAVIGEERLARLVSYLGGTGLSVPLELLTPASRRALIRELDAKGLQQSVIARQLRCSQRIVRDELWRRGKPRSRAFLRRKDDRQIDLEDLLKVSSS